MAIISNIQKTNRSKIYEGSTKDVFQMHDDESTLQLFFKDDMIISGESLKISGKGVINNSISSYMMMQMDLIGLENHFIEKSNMREQVIQILDMLPVQVRVSNVAVDSYVTSYGVQEGYIFETPMIEFRVKNRASGNPVINQDQKIAFNWASLAEIREVKKLALRANDFLTGYFAGCGFRLIESYFEFGRVFNGEDFIFMLADEITPESCILWDMDSNDKFDIETIAKSNNPIALYQEVQKRLRVK